MDYAKYGITANSYCPGVIETPLCKWIWRIFPSILVSNILSPTVAGLDEYYTKISGEPKGSWTNSVGAL